MLNIYDNYTYLNDTNNKSFCYIFYNKNKIDICFKGTSNINDFYSNLQICPSIYFNNTNIQIHNGFLNKYLSLKNSIISILNNITIDNNNDKQIEISFNGHSSGGGIATIAALDFSYIYNDYDYDIKCYTFGAPIIGNSYFINEFNKRINKNKNRSNSYRIINEYDVIPYLNLYENNNNNDNNNEQEIRLKNVKRTPFIEIIKNIYEYLKITHGITRYIKNLND
jgi:predicted lipase